MAAAAVAATAAAFPRDPNDPSSQGLKRKSGEPDGRVVDAQPERAWVKCIGDEAAPCCWDENGLILRLAPGGAIAAPLKFVAYGGAPGDGTCVDEHAGRVFVTGKCWPWLFEIAVELPESS